MQKVLQIGLSPVSQSVASQQALRLIFGGIWYERCVVGAKRHVHAERVLKECAEG